MEPVSKVCNFRPYFGYADQLYYGRQSSHGSWSKQEPAYLFYKYFPKRLFTFVFEQFCRLQWLENPYYIWGAVQMLNLEIVSHADFFFFPYFWKKKKKETICFDYLDTLLFGMYFRSYTNRIFIGKVLWVMRM